MARQLNRLRQRRGRSLRSGLIAAAIVALMPTAAFAGTASDTATVPPTDTDFAQTVSVDKFDPAQGTLESVTLSLDGAVAGTMEIENTSTSSGGLGTVQLSASVSLSHAADPSIAVAQAAIPADAQTFGVSVFDGTVDFAGSSGVSIAGSATDGVTETFTDAATLAAFTGYGTVDFIVEAVGTSFAMGDTGNIVSKFATQASAAVTVSYEYVEAQLPNISIEKTPDLQTVDSGSDAPFTITVTNTGPVDLVNVVVTDPLAPDCNLEIGDLAVGASSTHECAAFAVTEPFTNVAYVTGEDENGNQVEDDDDAAVELGGVLGIGAIVIEKTPDQQTVVVGSDAPFTITVTNAGPVDLVNVVVTDPLATDCDRVIGDLAVGESVSYDCVAPGVTQPFTNVASVTGEDEEGNVVEDEDDADVDVVSDGGDVPDIDIEKTPDLQTVMLGSDAPFTITVTNTGPVDLINVTVTDPRSPDCDAALGSLAIGASSSYECAAFDVSEAFTNVATVTGEDEDGNGVSDSDDARVEVGDVLPLTGIDSSSIALAGLLLLGAGASLVLLVRGNHRTVVALLIAFFMVTPFVFGSTGAAEAVEVTTAETVADVTVAHTDTIPSTLTNWDSQFTFPQFDPAQGDLIDVTVTLTGSIGGSMSVENTSTSSGCSATLDWGGKFTMDTMGGELVVTPAAYVADELASFDGNIDYEGASGASHAGLTAVDEGTTVVDDPAALDAFKGTGDIGLGVSAYAATMVTGCGNIVQVLMTAAAAEASVVYRYSAAADMPAIDIEKHTNGEDADEPTGPAIPIGDPVVWEYFVTNTGDVNLTGVTVSDDQGVSVTCPQDALAVGMSMTCTGSGVAQEGQYANIGTATGFAPDGSSVQDTDPSHYVGATIFTWLDCAHGDIGCLGMAGEAPGPVQVFIDGVEFDCETESLPGTILERFNCMWDSRLLPETVDIEVYAAGELLWVGTDLNTVCFEVSDPTDEPDDGDDGSDDADDHDDVDDRVEGNDGNDGRDADDRDDGDDADEDGDDADDGTDEAAAGNDADDGADAAADDAAEAAADDGVEADSAADDSDKTEADDASDADDAPAADVGADADTSDAPDAAADAECTTESRDRDDAPTEDDRRDDECDDDDADEDRRGDRSRSGDDTATREDD